MQQIDLTPKDLIASWWQKVLSYTGCALQSQTAKTLAHTLGIELVGGFWSPLALVPDDLEGLVVPVIDARRNNVYAGFTKKISWSHQKGIFHLRKS